MSRNVENKEDVLGTSEENSEVHCSRKSFLFLTLRHYYQPNVLRDVIYTLIIKRN